MNIHEGKCYTIVQWKAYSHNEYFQLTARFFLNKKHIIKHVIIML